MTGEEIEWDEFSLHEALDRTFTCQEIISTILGNHRVIASDNAYFAKAEEAIIKLTELYQLINERNGKRNDT